VTEGERKGKRGCDRRREIWREREKEDVTEGEI
jgi:hypothetical protein